MKIKILLILLSTIFVIFIGFSQDSSDYCNLPPDQGSPGGDTPDDNYSFSNGNTTQYSINSNCLIYLNGYLKQANALFGGDYLKDYNSAEQFYRAYPIFIIPAGGLFGIENSNIFKTVLQEYVRLGGTVVVFSQQYGSHIDNIVPILEGESLHTYGWREDQSCMGWAGYFRQMHPALAAMTTQQVYINVDGYFSAYPSNATVLLRRVSNQQPCLISYPYGNGTVILTSMYTDWGAAHSQASSSELRGKPGTDCKKV